MTSPSFGGDTHTSSDPSSKLQPIPLKEGLTWAGEPWDEERSVGAFEEVDGRPAYVRKQVIVTGRRDDVRAVVSEALEDSKTLRNPIDLERLLPADALGRFPDQGQGPVIIDLYDTGELSVRRAVQAIYEQATKRGKAVFADPNYVTGHPYIPVGSPVGVPEAAPGGFWEQWAFGGQWGIGLTAGGQRLSSLSDKGAGIRVAVFDTSPFENSGPWEIPWIRTRLKLNVTHLLARAQAREGPTADHGLFVAGLVHAVAPDSQIELIQVLNEEALGDLDTLNYALAQFMLQRLSSAGTLNNTVMNLSLGFPQAHHLADFELADLSMWYSSLMTSLGMGTPDPLADEVAVVCLETLLLGAHWQGATVVAAAGNESSPQVAVPAEAPAAYPSVIGAMASTRAGMRACFSNEGDVVAPGGDSNVDAATNTCEKALDDMCENGLISLVLNTFEDAPDERSGYACWAGTSFSAPLVSGLAALLLESQGLPPSAIVSADVTVGATMAPSGLHIINVPGSLGLP